MSMPSAAAVRSDRGVAEVAPFLIEPAISFQFKAVSVIELDAFFLQQAPLKGVAPIARWGI
jgi:hypothetical protein